MRIARVVAAVLAGLLLASCGKPAPTAGYVVEKQYVPARDWVDHAPIYIHHCLTIPYTYSTGSGMSRHTVYSSRQRCTSTLMGWNSIPRHEDRYWRLELKDDADAKHLGWRDVTEVEYQRYEVGAHYPDSR